MRSGLAKWLPPRAQSVVIDRANSESGFTVLEAMVAMALLAAAFIPLLQIQFQFVSVTTALDRAHDAMDHKRVTHNFLQTVNFDQLPSGSTELNNSVLRWEALKVGGPWANKSVDGGDGRFTLTLYTIKATVSPLNGGRAIEYSTQGLGWDPKFAIIEGL